MVIRSESWKLTRQYLIWLLISLGLWELVPLDHSEHSVFVVNHERAMSSIDEIEWQEFYEDSYAEHLANFDALFNATEVKRSKNNRVMVKGAHAKSFKFVSTK